MEAMSAYEAAFASEILATRKPMYEGQRTWVNYAKPIDRVFSGIDQASQPARVMSTSDYSIEFNAKRNESGSLVWVQSMYSGDGLPV